MKIASHLLLYSALSLGYKERRAYGIIARAGVLAFLRLPTYEFSCNIV
jgi:hypothetical protein